MRYIFCICLLFGSAFQAHASDLERNLFSGVSQRFTAFRQYVYTKDWRLLSVSELPNGKYLFDVNLAKNRQVHPVIDVKTGAVYSVRQRTIIAPEVLQKGFDYQFDVFENNSTLFLNTKNNVLAYIYYDSQADRYFETHYVQSAALLCTALLEMKSRAQNKMAISIFKEILTAAIKSYAGMSYSGGTFTGTSGGNSFSGTYTNYDRSWLGLHYERGLDAIFSGTASISQLNGEIEKYRCENTHSDRVNSVEQPSAINNFEKATYDIPK